MSEAVLPPIHKADLINVKNGLEVIKPASPGLPENPSKISRSLLPEFKACIPAASQGGLSNGTTFARTASDQFKLEQIPLVLKSNTGTTVTLTFGVSGDCKRFPDVEASGWFINEMETSPFEDESAIKKISVSVVLKIGTNEYKAEFVPKKDQDGSTFFTIPPFQTVQGSSIDPKLTFKAEIVLTNGETLSGELDLTRAINEGLISQRQCNQVKK